MLCLVIEKTVKHRLLLSLREGIQESTDLDVWVLMNARAENEGISRLNTRAKHCRTVEPFMSVL